METVEKRPAKAILFCFDFHIFSFSFLFSRFWLCSSLNELACWHNRARLLSSPTTNTNCDDLISVMVIYVEYLGVVMDRSPNILFTIQFDA
jgi:hypothetical protein